MIMKNPIPYSGLFGTRSLREIKADIDTLPPRERALVYSYVGDTLNACHVLTKKVIEEISTRPAIRPAARRRTDVGR